ncbi:hypothetical protein LTR91_001445 [Friedmanniomyces endolithicus]|uniref:Uncharacterized protein n=1 Tax=Friedmanniomyces endolithicus TaxID=329885 RepID=A0AAN6L0F9_9PEZI|nr:hypothetical protein LTR01_000478 [Friedmanniomyces endolithicus]KAK0834903.1 hypothetical protein LTR73_001195 [Friedmanniomyces endolithicus]KAK0923694.1 hypothetical protein LTR57_006628 [Friedmanniomyces endolithicus]KAK0984054.1 hypothetical protein LTS01_010802 [Friedmanniomyces endolithicus]KAK1013135.1 hypothetical protein LTR91_001445 [Friedmanniomyces endolithicus]
MEQHALTATSGPLPDHAYPSEPLNPSDEPWTNTTTPDPAAETDRNSVAVTDSTNPSPAPATPPVPAPATPPEPNPAVVMAGKTKSRKGLSPMKSFRYEDAADAAPPVVVGKVPKPSELMRDMKDVSTEGVEASSAGSVRSGNGSSKIAGLRATFEKGGAGGGGVGGAPAKERNSGGSFSSVKRRFTSHHDKLEVPNGKTNGHGQQSNGKEMASLKEDLDRERELCQAYVDKCAMLEEEAIKLRLVYDEKCTFLIEEADQQQHTLHRKAEQQRTAFEEKYAVLVDKAQERRETFEERYAVLEHEVEDLRTKLSQHSPVHNDSPATSPQSSLSSRPPIDPEVLLLRRQLADLKRTISLSTRMDSQVTDSVFAQETSTLHHELQNWTVHHFRRAPSHHPAAELRLRLDDLDLTPGQRHQLRPMYAAYDPLLKLPMYQATAVSLFMAIFADESLYGLPEDLPWRLALRTAVGKLENVLSPAAHNKWRAVTVDVIRQSDGMQGYIDAAARALAGRVCTVLSVLTGVTEGSEGRLAALTGIARRAIELQHLFRVQRARYQFDLPCTSDLFYAEVMENISVDVEPTAAGGESRVVTCATFPSVMKIGDEWGDNAHLTNVIVKAKVVCS